MAEPRRKRKKTRPDPEPKRPPVSLQAGHSTFDSRALWVSLALIAVTVAVYAPVRHYEFVTWDDPQYILQNLYVTRGLTGEGVSWALTTGYQANWHPLTWLSHMLDVQLFGLNAGAHHVINLLLHIANTILLFGVLYRMTGALGRSAFVAGLFAVHPLHVESVAWVTERKDVLSTLFWMLTLWAYMDYVRRPRTRRYALVMLLFALGLMSKPMLVTLPLVLLLLDFWPLGRISLGSRLLWEKVPLFALTVASSLVTFLVQQEVGAVAALDALPLQFRATNAVVSYVAYLRDMLWPARLAAFYPYRAVPGWLVGASLLGLIAVSVIVIRAARRWPYLPVGWLWYLGTLFPVIGLLQVGGQSRADRYTYVPLIGVFLIVAWGVHDLVSRWRYHSVALRAAAMLVIASLAVASRAQAQHWKTSLALWQRAADVTTGNYRAHNHLGVALSDQGKNHEAIVQYSEALRIWPDFAEAHVNLAVALAEQGKIDEAITHYNKALQIKPNSPDAHNNLGAALAEKGRLDESIREFLESLRLKPDQPDVHCNVAIMYQRKGAAAEALRHYEAALRLNPAHREARRGLDELRSQK